MNVLPVTPARIARDVGALGVRPGDVVLVHTSLSAISGPHSMVAGGPVGVLEGLFEALTDAGTLVVPAFSADYSDPASWTNPPVSPTWWPVLRESMPAWRADRAPTFRIGLVAETFRRVDGVRRSEHPQLSFCAWGKHAEAIVAPHGLDDPLGVDGPLGRLRAMDATVLLVGCGFGSCTAFHLAEHETDVPRVTSAAPVLRDGQRVWARWSQPDYDASRFAAIGQGFARTAACTRGLVGAATTYRFRLADGVAFARAALAEG